jgi:hypothetical protein
MPRSEHGLKDTAFFRKYKPEIRENQKKTVLSRLPPASPGTNTWRIARLQLKNRPDILKELLLFSDLTLFYI